MRITEIDHRTNPFFRDGLQPLHLRDLKRVVLLCGPNGAGKSRLLTRVSALNGSVTDCLGNSAVVDRIRRYPPFTDFFSGSRYSLSDLNLRTAAVPDGLVHISSLGVSVTVDPRTSRGWHEFVVLPFVTFQLLGLRNPDDLTGTEIQRSSRAAQSGGVQNLSENGPAYLQLVQDAWWNSTHPSSRAEKSEKEAAAEAYSYLNEIVEIVLGARLDRSLHGKVTLFDKPIAAAGLSHGQQALLLWGIALHAQALTIRDAILVMDEPENHLHPAAMNATVRRIIEAVAGGQVWIATHSVPLIASLFQGYSDDISLVFVDQGKASYAGREPERVLESLMGGEDNIGALRQFIDLPDLFATNRFAAESLVAPDVIADANPDDPQVRLASDALFANPAGGSIKVLDIGAGQGRLLESLAAGVSDLPTKLEYVGFDTHRHQRCAEVINRVYGEAADVTRLFTDLPQLAGKHNKNSFDAVVMCNVLHEIDPLDWLNLFKEVRELRWALKPEGKLLLIEDYLMPKGEYAHPYGFIVLDTSAIKALFGEAAIEVHTATGKYAERIKLHSIPASALANVTAATRRSALRQACEAARSKVQVLRERQSKTFRAGQAHGFWVQQYANTNLALEQLGES